ncbi:hypothetical protein [Krasilnikovia sp. M28-CT-15]
MHRQEPHRTDLVDELYVEIIDVLEPFERVGTITPRGTELLICARD